MSILIKMSEKPNCLFCGSNEDNEINYGPLYTIDGVTVHYFCVLLSTKLLQNGKDNEGILGFLIPDILREFRRAQKRKCSFCGKCGANILCSARKCNINFHLPCGLNHRSLHEFTGQYLSFCGRHKAKVQMSNEERQNWKNGQINCGICFEKILPTIRWKCNRAPCCFKSWFHRSCLQQLANNAGYFFKCPICNNRNKFVPHMERNGIFVPQRDASWELEPNAFVELLYKYEKCDAPVCKCPKGREKSIGNSKWEIMLCRMCGSQGIHVECGNLKQTHMKWVCSECEKITAVNSQSKSKSSRNVRQIDNEGSSNSTNNVAPKPKKKRKRRFTAPRRELKRLKLSTSPKDKQNEKFEACHITNVAVHEEEIVVDDDGKETETESELLEYIREDISHSKSRSPKAIDFIEILSNSDEKSDDDDIEIIKEIRHCRTKSNSSVCKKNSEEEIVELAETPPLIENGLSNEVSPEEKRTDENNSALLTTNSAPLTTNSFEVVGTLNLVPDLKINLNSLDKSASLENSNSETNKIPQIAVLVPIQTASHSLQLPVNFFFNNSMPFQDVLQYVVNPFQNYDWNNSKIDDYPSTSAIMSPQKIRYLNY